MHLRDPGNDWVNILVGKTRRVSFATSIIMEDNAFNLILMELEYVMCKNSSDKDVSCNVFLKEPPNSVNLQQPPKRLSQMRRCA